MSSNSGHTPISSTDNARITNANANNTIDEESLGIVRSLLHQEMLHLASSSSSSAYLSHLTKWRDHLFPSSPNPQQQTSDFVFLGDTNAESAEVAALASLSRHHNATMTNPSHTLSNPLLSSETPMTAETLRSNAQNGINNDALEYIADSHGSKPAHDVAEAYPNQHPDVLMQWRAKCVDWLCSIVEQEDFEYNTLLVALSYLDAYSLSVCFPEEFKRLRGSRSSKQFEDTSSSLDPTPPKKRKISHHDDHDDDDYLLEYIGNNSQQKQFGEETVRGILGTHYMLACITSLYLATKLFQPLQTNSRLNSPSCFTTLYDSISVCNIEKMELHILDALDYRVHPPTALRFVQEFMPVLFPRPGEGYHGGTSSSFALDSRPWAPQDDTEEEIIYNGTQYMVMLACTFGAAADFRPVVDAKPSKIALAAIAQAALEYYLHDEKLIVQYQAFRNRLTSLIGILQFDKCELEEIRKCLVDIKCLHTRQENALPREGSPTTVVESTTQATKDSSKGPSCKLGVKKANARRISCETTDKCRDGPVAPPTIAAIHNAVSKSSSGGKARKCPSGRKHRLWEEGASAANKPSGFYSLAEMAMHDLQD